MMGQNDLMPTAFVVASTVIGTRALELGDGADARIRQADLSALLLAIGAGFKLYPLLLVFPFGLVIGRRTRDVVRFVIVGFVPFLLVIAPFLPSPGFRLQVLGNPEAQRITAMVPGLGPTGFSPFIVAYFGLIGYLIYRRSAPSQRPFPVPLVAFATLGLVFATIDWFGNFYWLVWLMPFVIWAVMVGPSTYPIFVGFVAIFLWATWTPGNAASSGLFRPIASGAVDVLPIRTILEKVYSWGGQFAIMHSIFTGLLISQIMVALLLRRADPNATLSFVETMLPLAIFVGWLVVSFVPAVFPALNLQWQ
jgi:hypothetical protein